MLRSYSAPNLDFGLFAYEQSWLGIFTAGFNGQRAQIIGIKRADGNFDAFVLGNNETTGEWPPASPKQIPCGLMEVVSVNDTAMVLRYSLDRYALGAPLVDFSPMPEQFVTGTITLSRLV